MSEAKPQAGGCGLRGSQVGMKEMGTLSGLSATLSREDEPKGGKHNLSDLAP